LQIEKKEGGRLFPDACGKPSINRGRKGDVALWEGGREGTCVLVRGRVSDLSQEESS